MFVFEDQWLAQANDFIELLPSLCGKFRGEEVKYGGTDQLVMTSSQKLCSAVVCHNNGAPRVDHIHHVAGSVQKRFNGGHLPM